MHLPEEILALHRNLGQHGGRVVVVGGAVRDFLLNRNASKDLDLEVFGVSPDQLEAVLKGFGKVQLAGRSFSVWKLQTQHAMTSACHAKSPSVVPDIAVSRFIPTPTSPLLRLHGDVISRSTASGSISIRTLGWIPMTVDKICSVVSCNTSVPHSVRIPYGCCVQRDLQPT